MDKKFINPEKNITLDPVSWFNAYGDFKIIFANSKTHYYISDSEIGTFKNKNKVVFKLLKNGFILTDNDECFDIPNGDNYTKFMLLCKAKFKSNYNSAMGFIKYEFMKVEIPYIRVGVDYYKKIFKPTRYGGNAILLKHWRKEEIKQDYDSSFIAKIYKFDDFTIEPNNKEYRPVVGNYYNLYSEFQHKVNIKDVTENDVKISLELMNHIFGNKIDIGLKYLKCLFEHPKQILPILSLVSEERGTGKTTFLNWISMIFGENTVLVSPDDIARGFNSVYSNKNIIMIDEAVAEKNTTVEKLKSLATAKSISVSQKFVSEYSIPFYGKIILCTNKETDFMKIDNEEVRFFVLKVPVIKKLNTAIETQLFKEIPSFLKYLLQLPEIDFSKSRMVFTKDEIESQALEMVKEESKSGLFKEIEMNLEDFFYNNSNYNSFLATPKDIKEKWFNKENNISSNYIKKTLNKEMKLFPELLQRYSPFDSTETKIGTPYLFINKYQRFENEKDSFL
jgi:predicted ABC-type ATPase